MDGEIKIIAVHVGKKQRVIVKSGGDVLHANVFDPSSERQRKAFIKNVVAKAPALKAEELEAELLKLVDSSDAHINAIANGTDTSAELLANMPADVRAEADAMLRDPLLIKTVIDDVAALDVAGERELIATVFMIGVSRQLPRPLAGIVQGPSSSGKSYLIEKTATVFPPESVIHATQMTPQALFHMKPGALVHKFIVAGERSRLDDDERVEATRALREMLSSGRLTKLMPVKQPGGAIETVVIEQDGPIAFIESTTMSKIFDEDQNRCLMLHTDEQPEQTRRIIG